MFDFTPSQRSENTSLEKTLSSFSKRNNAIATEERETDALGDIYKKYQSDGNNINNAIADIQSRPGISPTARVNNVNALLQLQKDNVEQQKKALEAQQNQKILTDLEQRRGLEEGSLGAYASDPKMAEQVSRPAAPPKQNQADRPIDADQLKRIQHVRNNPEFEKATPSKKYQMLTDAGVSAPNAKTEADLAAQEGEIDKARDKAIEAAQAQKDVAFVEEQAKAGEASVKQLDTLKAGRKLNSEGVTGKNWDIAMNAAGLVNYTSAGYREFASYAKEAVKNQNIKSVVGSQMSQREFQFFVDATINPNFSQEANNRVLMKEEIAARMTQLYSDITAGVIEQNGGKIPRGIHQQVNKEFSIQSKKLQEELAIVAQDYEAIQYVPPGKVLMYDEKRRPLHVDADKVAEATALGATSI